MVVLVFYVGNDLIDNSAELARAAPDGSPTRPFFSLDGNRLKLTPVPRHPGFGQDTWLQMASDRSALIDFVISGVGVKAQYADASETMRKTDRQVFAQPPPPELERSWAVTGALLLATRDATEAAGARFVLVVAPHKAQLDPADEWQQWRLRTHFAPGDRTCALLLDALSLQARMGARSGTAGPSVTGPDESNPPVAIHSNDPTWMEKFEHALWPGLLGRGQLRSTTLRAPPMTDRIVARLAVRHRGGAACLS